MGVLQGKIAVITGGNSGIGAALQSGSLSKGAFVFTGRRQGELDRAKETNYETDMARPFRISH